MGSDAEGAQDSEKPVHMVIVPDFEMAHLPVDCRDYTRCIQERRCDSGSDGDYCPAADEERFPALDDRDMSRYLNWRGDGTRLCSEAEWEYAARSGGLDRVYTWGNTPSPSEVDWGSVRQICPAPLLTEQGVCGLAGSRYGTGEQVADHHFVGYEIAPVDGSPYRGRAPYPVSPEGGRSLVVRGMYADVSGLGLETDGWRTTARFSLWEFGMVGSALRLCRTLPSED